jgi:hypothetical protein
MKNDYFKHPFEGAFYCRGKAVEGTAGSVRAKEEDLISLSSSAPSTVLLC